MRHAALLFIVVAATVQSATTAEHPVLVRTYAQLDRVRDRKRAELQSYLQRMQRLADSVASDQVMADFFRLKMTYYQTQKKIKPPAEAAEAIDKLKASIRAHYLRRYMAFYDILCIAQNGDIFFTVRQEADYHKNIFKGDLAKTALSKRLADGSRKTFVDYEYYASSGEPSAFFVEPVVEEDQLLGWFVLQCATNKINSMFSQDARLGTTGEVILVNQHHSLLTDSRFYGESNILKRHLSDENIQEKFRQGKGHKIVTDYRGFRAITSFEVCPVGTSRWLVIAKIHEDEVITQEYLNRKEQLSADLLRHFHERPARQDPPNATDKECTREFTRVDMDEYRKAESKEALGTYGVSTCTAVVISYPGKFAYMGHLSTYDRVYGANGTDLIGNMLNHIRDFDICRSELRNLRVTLVAPHLNSLAAATDLLLKEGLLLSQIRVLHRSDAEHGTVFFDPKSGNTLVHWSTQRGGNREQVWESDANAGTLGAIIKKLIELP